jgi:hypothetical protein
LQLRFGVYNFSLLLQNLALNGSSLGIADRGIGQTRLRKHDSTLRRFNPSFGCSHHSRLSISL